MDENGPFVVDLSTQSGDFPYSYGSLPEGNGNIMGIAIQFFEQAMENTPFHTVYCRYVYSIMT